MSSATTAPNPCQANSPAPASGAARRRGMRHIAAVPALRGVTVATAVAMIVFGFGESALFAVAELALGLPTEFVGVLMMVQGVGAVIAGPVSGFLAARFGELRLAAAGLVLLAISSVLYVVPAMPVVLLGLVLGGGGLPWLAVGATTLLQRRSPQRLQGRAYTAFELSITVPQTLSIAVGAALIGVVGYQALLLSASVVIGVAALLVIRAARRDTATSPASASADDLPVEDREPGVPVSDPVEPALADRG